MMVSNLAKTREMRDSKVRVSNNMENPMMDDNQPTPESLVGDSLSAPTPGHSAARRRVLMVGAAGVAAAVTVRPAFAQTAASVFNCEIPVPEPVSSGQHIALDGTLVPAGTQGAFPGSTRPFTGEEVRAALQGRSLPGTTYEQGSAYMNYIRRLRAGQSGFTCYASIQVPR